MTPIPEDVSRAINTGEVRRALERNFPSSVVEWLMDAIFIREHKEMPRRR